MPQKIPWRRSVRRIVSAGKRSLGGVFAIVLLTAVCLRLNANLAIASLLFLLVTVLQSLVGDLISSFLVSLIGVACLDFFFTEPLYTFTVARGVDIIALISFFAAALVITQLVSRTRREAQAARTERERMERLYQLSQRLLSIRPQAAQGLNFLDAFLGVFGATAICIFDANTAGVQTAGKLTKELADRTRDAYVFGVDSDYALAGISVRRMQVGGKMTGAIGFQNLEDPELTSGPLTILALTLLERNRALREASDSAAAAQAEVYRSAILDALAHEFKTPLATILAAAGGLSEAGPLNSDQSEMAEIVEAEAARLGNLTSRLLRMARLDREEINPRLEIVDLGAIVAQLAEQQARRSPDRSVSFSPFAGSLEVRADEELLRLAVGQLLENACKYSGPGSAVGIQLVEEQDCVAIRVSNNGSSISDPERYRIFDRFYRGANSGRLAPGSGLGLYVARKIAAAHGGALDLESGGQSQHEVTFRLTLPARRIEADHVVATNAGDASN